MPLISPFRALRPVAARAADVAAPPYDVLDADEARSRASGKPWSFLHISRPEIDLPADTDPHAPEVYAKAADNLARMLNQGILLRDPQPCYYVYRMILDDHGQTGLVAAASLADYDSNRIRKHEFTRPDKEDDRVRQIEALNAQTGPALLAYPSAPEVDDILARATEEQPVADVTADTGVRHILWSLSDAPRLQRLTALFDAMPALYIADGHHRCAAASRVAAARRGADPGSHSGRDEEAGDQRLLTVIFPHRQMRILDYNRVMKDLGQTSAEGLLLRIAESFTVSASAQPVRPARRGEFGLYLPGRWYRLEIQPRLIPTHDPVGRLDVSLLSDHLLAPMLGIVDQRRDPRIDFVGGIRGLEELERRVDRGEMAAAFSLHPTSMEDLMGVADAGKIMPPKSTWFEPKLADGLVSHVLD